MKVLIISGSHALIKKLTTLLEPYDIDILSISGYDKPYLIKFARESDIVVVHSINKEGTELHPLDILKDISCDKTCIIFTNQIDPVRFFMEIKKRYYQAELVLEMEGVGSLFNKIVEILEKKRIVHDIRPEISEMYDRIYGNKPPFLISFSPAMKDILSTATYFATERNLSVLITGETGTGKELLARFMHTMGNRGGPMVTVNCADFKGSDLNITRSELFGHKKGAFTGAVSDRKGAFERANKGTIFLDELEELPLSVQAELLRVLQERKITPLGSEREIEIDVKIISATNKKVEDLLKTGALRQDLYYRIAGGIISLPPLRERGEIEIKLLLEHFIRKYSRGKYIGVDKEFVEALFSYEWPGNVREFEQLILKLVSMTGDKGILVRQMLPQEKFGHKKRREYIKGLLVTKIREIINSIDLSALTCDDILELKEEFEAILMEPTFLKCGFNFSKMARELQTTKDLRKRKSAEILKNKFIIRTAKKDKKSGNNS